MSALRKLPLLIALALCALLLALLPLPGAIDVARPYWLLVVLGAWAYRQGNTYLLATALVAGLLLDAARGIPLGLNAFALLLPLALLLRWRAPLRQAPLWQLAAGGVLLFVLHALLLSLLHAATGEQVSAAAHWWPVPTSVLMWLVAVGLLHPALRQRREA